MQPLTAADSCALPMQAGMLQLTLASFVAHTLVLWPNAECKDLGCRRSGMPWLSRPSATIAGQKGLEVGSRAPVLRCCCAGQGKKGRNRQGQVEEVANVLCAQQGGGSGLLASMHAAWQ